MVLTLLAAGLIWAQSDDGKRLYQGHCAPCHGATATGGRGPDLTAANLKSGTSEEALFAVIRDGVAGTEMPRAWQMTDREIRLVIAYFRSLSRTSPQALKGDAARGGKLYSANGCAGCHIVNGEGRGIGPELTSIGISRGPDYLRRSVAEPAADVPERYAMFRFTPLAGAAFTAARLNEDVFHIQVRTAAGQFQSLRKSQFKSIEKLEGRSEMPSYKGKLSPEQLDDLVAYLAGLRGRP